MYRCVTAVAGETVTQCPPLPLHNQQRRDAKLSQRHSATHAARSHLTLAAQYSSRHTAACTQMQQWRTMCVPDTAGASTQQLAVLHCCRPLSCATVFMCSCVTCRHCCVTSHPDPPTYANPFVTRALLCSCSRAVWTALTVDSDSDSTCTAVQAGCHTADKSPSHQP